MSKSRWLRPESERGAPLRITDWTKMKSLPPDENRKPVPLESKTKAAANEGQV